MSGYKLVSFYELCRLCASSSHKQKTHIFQEEGKKNQLQYKIQTLLSLTITEDDCLPKIVCERCIKQLEVCFTFREECMFSESMLSTYFKKCKNTEDFRKSGKVYIRDTEANTYLANKQTIKTVQSSQGQQNPVEMPFYIQLPAIVTNPSIPVKNVNNKESTEKINQVPLTQPTYNINLLNSSSIKSTIQGIVNVNGEVINVSQLNDIETQLQQNSIVKGKINKTKRPKDQRTIVKNCESIVQVDLTKDTEPVVKYEKLPHIKSTQNSVERTPEKTSTDMNTTMDYQMSDYPNTYSYDATTDSMCINTISSGNIIQNSNVICTSTSNTSTVDTNQLGSSVETYTNLHNMVPHPQEKPPEKLGTQNGSPPKRRLSSSSSSDPEPRSHACEVCSRTFKRREHLYQHMKLHTGFRPFVCGACGKAFMRKEHLLRHTTLHSGQKNYACDVCNKYFSRNDNLLKHKKVHEKQTSFTCEICQKVFVMKHYYEAHRATHGDKCYMGEGLKDTSSNWAGLCKT